MTFRALLSALVLALAIAVAPSARAQNPEQIVAWGEQIQATHARVMTAGQAVSSMSTVFRGLRGREDLLAATRSVAPALAQARQELAGAREALDRMPAAESLGHAEMAAYANSVVRDLRVLIDNFDALLGEAQQLEPAIVANDNQRIARIAERLQSGAILLIATQANAMRSQQFAWEPSNSDYHILGGLASFYDGLGAIFSARSTADAPRIAAAAEEMRRANAAARSTLAAERAALASLPAAQRGYETRQLALNERSIGVLEEAAAALGVMPDAITGDIQPTHAAALARQLIQYEQRLQAISVEQSQLALEELR